MSGSRKFLVWFTAIAIVVGAPLTAAVAEEALPINPAVTQATIFDTICIHGWTRTVRPYVSTMKSIKRDMLAAIGEPIEHRNRYELDHKIPLALGGDPLDRRNLALQLIDEAREKDAVEVCLSALVCQGRIGLDEAQEAIWSDWRKASEACTNGGTLTP